MLRYLILVIGWLGICPDTFAIRFNQYHDYPFIQRYMRETAAIYDHIQYNHLGYSMRGLEISYFEITKSKNPKAPAIYINGTHHGNERASTEASLGLIDFLSRKHRDRQVDRLLRHFRYIIQPVVNPDGLIMESRFAANGTDPNRDYPHPTNMGKPFQLRETRLVSKLLRQERFKGSLAYHSGIEAILWPWCFSNKKVYHEREFFILGKLVADAMSIRKFVQSYEDYKSEGEFIDYAYMNYGTFALTVEVSPLPKPPVYHLPGVVKKAVAGFIAFSQGLKRMENNKVSH